MTCRLLPCMLSRIAQEGRCTMAARALVAAVAVLACVGICAADAPAGFIRAQDSRFVDANCNEFNFVGANTCVAARATGGPQPDRKTSVGGLVPDHPICRFCDSMHGPDGVGGADSPARCAVCSCQTGGQHLLPASSHGL